MNTGALYRVFGTDRMVRGWLYGRVEKGRLRWCKLASRPPHHVENCDCSLCWQVVWPEPVP